MKDFTTEDISNLSLDEPHTPKSRRLPKGSSDPVSFTCTCPASSSPDGGQVLLFYRYFASPPSLLNLALSDEEITSLATFQTTETQKHSLGGKIRIAKEGFNITVGGTTNSISAYIKECISHWSFAGLSLGTEQEQREFFKPSPGGCACVFGGCPASVRVTSEITPMGVTNYLPTSWSNISVLSPSEFHEKCHNSPDVMLLDMRNYYESRIGYFVSPLTGEPAFRPAIRRFSQWPLYVRRYMSEGGNVSGGKEVLTFCTGGIRCEKGARLLEESMPGGKVATLKGGIAGYLMWMEREIKSGRKKPEDSLFKGRNFVFDGRGSTTLGDGKGEPVAKCHVCKVPSDRLSKCRSRGCHLVLVVCAECEMEVDPRCCQNCFDMDILAHEEGELKEKSGPRPICACEKEREAELWGGEYMKPLKIQKSRKGKQPGVRRVDEVDIRVKVID